MRNRSREARLVGVAVLALAALASPSVLAADTPDEPEAGPPIASVDLDQLDLASLVEARVSLTIRSDMSPYESVRYEIKRRGSTLIASLSKQLAGGYDELGGVALLPADDLPRLLDALRTCGVESIPDEGATHFPALSYELELDFGPSYQRRTRFAGLRVSPGTQEWCTVRLITDTYAELGDPVPFENRFWNDGEFGQLQLDSSPAASVLIDGRDVGLTTPIRSVRLDPGVHALRFVNAGLGIDRTYDVTIELGLTTRLDVELR